MVVKKRTSAHFPSPGRIGMNELSSPIEEKRGPPPVEGRPSNGSEEPSIAVPSIAAKAIRNDGRQNSPIFIGARIKMSLLGAKRNPHLARREGTVVGFSRLNSSVRVRFHELKTPISLHRNYIEPEMS